MRTWYIDPLAGTDDLEGVLQVDALSFTNPWTRAMYESDFLSRDISRIYVLRSPEHLVAGYIAAWLIADEVHINNLAVRPECRGRGYGTALLAYALEEARRHGVRRALLEVRRSNDAARRLYERHGFRVAGVRRDYYTEPVEDALVLWRDEPVSGVLSRA
jgi:[ribosomal protein S18]-alanine N-acetyltransferase